MKAVSNFFRINPPTEELPTFDSHPGLANIQGKSDLEVNILLWELDTNLVLFISIDALYLGHDFTLEIKDHAHRLLGKETFTFVASSHAHSSPNLDPTKSKLCKLNPQFSETLLGQIKQAVEDLAKQDLKVITLAIAQKKFPSLSIYRRRKVFLPSKLKFSYAFLPNSTIQVDQDFTLLEWRAGNQTLAILIQWSCHPTSYPSTEEVHADFPAYIREQLRAEVGEDIPIVFFNGFCGNVKPNLGLVFAWKKPWKGLVFSRPTRPAYRNWIKTIQDSCANLWQSKQALEGTSTLKFFHASIPSHVFFETSNLPPSQFSMLCCGKVLIVVASPEMMTEYALWLKKELPEYMVVTIAYEGFCFGYLPTEEIQRQGGYEAVEFLEAFGMEEKWESNPDKIVKKMWKEWINQLKQ